MTTDIRLSATLRPTCEARTGFAPGDYGETPLWCRQVVGVTSFIDAQGQTRHHCSMDGHKAAVVARYGEARVDDWESRKAEIDAELVNDIELMADEFHGRSW